MHQLTEYLEKKVTSTVRKLDTGSAEKADKSGPEIVPLLKAAMKNERETALLSCLWALNEKDPNFAMDLARLAGDEAKHYQMLDSELQSKGQSFEVENNFSPLYKFLETQTETFERVITGPFAREYLATKRNQLFLEYCSKRGETSILKLYETIQADETHHFELGCRMMEKIVQSEQEMNHAKELIDQFLKVVDDIQEMLLLKKGLSYIPGC